MALTTGTVFSCQTLKSDAIEALGGLQIAEVLFTMSGTYDQSANSSLVGVPTLIQNSRRNGKTVALLGAMLSQRAVNATTPSTYLSMKTVAISGNDVTFELTDNSPTTELAAAGIPAQLRPFGLAIAFTES